MYRNSRKNVSSCKEAESEVIVSKDSLVSYIFPNLLISQRVLTLAPQLSKDTEAVDFDFVSLHKT